jgi:hypothetical protein|nr:MAG TPA: hypothetical protein [Caudoviricetes sp.]
MDQFEIQMAKYRKEIIKKAVNAIYKDSKVMYVLYMLYILKLNDITLHDVLYNFGATACFKLNRFNPLAWVLVIAYVILAIVRSVIKGIVVAVENIKRGIIVNFE